MQKIKPESRRELPPKAIVLDPNPATQNKEMTTFNQSALPKNLTLEQLAAWALMTLYSLNREKQHFYSDKKPVHKLEGGIRTVSEEEFFIEFPAIEVSVETFNQGQNSEGQNNSDAHSREGNQQFFVFSGAIGVDSSKVFLTELWKAILPLDSGSVPSEFLEIE